MWVIVVVVVLFLLLFFFFFFSSRRRHTRSSTVSWARRCGIRDSGYTTRNIACVPVRTMAGEKIGVMQTLNKRVGEFNEDDLELLEEMTTQAAVVLQGLQHYEQIDKIREKENAFLQLMSDINSEFEL